MLAVKLCPEVVLLSPENWQSQVPFPLLSDWDALAA
jgi:hypothetical protein